MDRVLMRCAVLLVVLCSLASCTGEDAEPDSVLTPGANPVTTVPTTSAPTPIRKVELPEVPADATVVDRMISVGSMAEKRKVVHEPGGVLTFAFTCDGKNIRLRGEFGEVRVTYPCDGTMPSFDSTLPEDERETVWSVDARPGQRWAASIWWLTYEEAGVFLIDDA